MAKHTPTSRDTGLRRVKLATRWIAAGAAVLTGFITVWEARAVRSATASTPAVVRPPPTSGDSGSPSSSDPSFSDQSPLDDSGNLQAPDNAPQPSDQPPVASSGGT